MNDNKHFRLIEELTAELEPVQPLRLATGLGWVALAAGFSLVIVLLVAGLRSGIEQASALFFITNGLLALLGMAATASVIAMASPRVGNRHDVPKWALAMAGVLPLATLLALATAHRPAMELIHPASGWHCLAYGLLAGVAAAGVMLWWLRRGAPTSPRLAGLYLGVAAGAIGSVTYGLSCPIDTVFHLGSWHVFPVIASGLLGILAVPPLLRW